MYTSSIIVILEIWWLNLRETKKKKKKKICANNILCIYLIFLIFCGWSLINPIWSCRPFIGTFLNKSGRGLITSHRFFSIYMAWDWLFPFYFPRTYVGYSSSSTVSQTWNTDTDVAELKLFNMTGAVSHSGKPPGSHWFTKPAVTNDHKQRQNKRKSPSHGLKARCPKSKCSQGHVFSEGF